MNFILWLEKYKIYTTTTQTMILSFVCNRLLKCLFFKETNKTIMGTVVLRDIVVLDCSYVVPKINGLAYGF